MDDALRRVRQLELDLAALKRQHGPTHEISGGDEVRPAVMNQGTLLARQRTTNFSTGLLATLNNANKRIDITTSGIPLGAVIRSSNDQEVTDATLVSSSELTTSVVAATEYGFRAVLFMLNDGAAEGIRLALGGTCTITALKAQISIYDDTTNALAAFARVTALGSAVAAGISAGSNYCVIEGGVLINAAGTFLVQFAQNVAGIGAGVHLEVDSTWEVWKAS